MNNKFYQECEIHTELENPHFHRQEALDSNDFASPHTRPLPLAFPTAGFCLNNSLTECEGSESVDYISA